MKSIISLLLVFVVSTASVSAQGLLGKIKRAAESVASATVKNAVVDFGEVPMPDINSIEWNMIKPFNKELPTITTSEFSASFEVEGYGVKFSDGKQFAYDGTVKSQAAMMTAGWKIFKNVRAVSKKPFELTHAKQCWYILSYELNEKGEPINREIHWVGWPVK